LVSEEHRVGIIPLVQMLIGTLEDESVAIDETHTPKIYARFLASLLQKHHTLASAHANANASRRAAGGAGAGASEARQHGNEQEQEQEHEHGAGTGTGIDIDADMMNTQQTMGLSIDFSMLHQANNIPLGPLSPPSPHPSIQVTPPPIGDHTFGFLLHDPNQHPNHHHHQQHPQHHQHQHQQHLQHQHQHHHHQQQHGDFDVNVNGGHYDHDLAMLANCNASNAPPSGSGTVHPLDGLREGEDEDEDVISPLQAINRSSFWVHALVPGHELVPGLASWPDTNLPTGFSVGPYAFMDS
jgi:hypothetical protein